MCYFHIKKNVEPSLKSSTKNGTAGHLKEDIYTLPTCPDEGTFTTVFNLFLKKWRKKRNSRVTDFVNYLEKEWFLKYPNWYEGDSLGQPSSNNGLESTNGVIKRNKTLRERLPVGQFLNCTAEMIQKWSRCRDPLSVNSAPYAEAATPSLKLWTDAFQWAVSNSLMLQRDEDDCTVYFVASSRMAPITPRISKKYQVREGRRTDFNDYKSWRTEVWTLSLIHI